MRLAHILPETLKASVNTRYFVSAGELKSESPLPSPN
jgi:hypothetical protein